MKSNFNEFLRTAGIENVEALSDFLNQIQENPEIIFDLSDEERSGVEGQMDRALELFRVTLE